MYANAAQALLVSTADAASISLTDSNGSPVPQSNAAEDAADTATAGRRLQGKSVAVPGLGPSAATVHALGSMDSAGADSPACESHSWTLALAAGGNDFTITVGMSTPPVSSAGSVTSWVAPLHPKP